MQCPICKNEDERFFGKINGKMYCRKCLTYEFKNFEKIKYHAHEGKDPLLHLNYELSEDQKKISEQVTKLALNKQNILIHAVTGAGKTELVFQVIDTFIKKGLQVGFAIPRKDVVIELAPRLKEAFINASVTSVYGGSTDKYEGDIIVLTTHQLNRYDHYFDLLIVDEVDAFPFNNNQILLEILHSSSRGVIVYMSATPPIELLKTIKKENILTLFKRFHGGKLIVPTVKCSWIPIFNLLIETKRIILTKKPLLIFCPTISLSKIIFWILQKFMPFKGEVVYSSKKDRVQQVEQFKKHNLQYLVTTSILERGITIKDLQVIIFNSDDNLYSKDILIQISGRVGRKIGATGGEVIFICQKKTQAISDCILEIQKYNEGFAKYV